jgi:hypothetical protein
MQVKLDQSTISIKPQDKKSSRTNVRNEMEKVKSFTSTLNITFLETPCDRNMIKADCCSGSMDYAGCTGRY